MKASILRVADVVGLLKISRATLWRWQRSGRFPKPVRLGPNSIGWHDSEVRAWLEARPRA